MAILPGMRNPELLPAFAVAFAAALARLRFIALSRWHCRNCGDSHLHCECKPVWLRLFL
ncbi:MAG TPA: hypothetical protein VFB25_11845 [Gaiellaceae bacterium]|nr:hypothetical protein [Gaiellaceae bacterium]